MHTHSLEKWSHRHVFLGKRHGLYERRTWMVVGITATMMVAEIVAGTVFGSMALLADGWHMATHAAAIGIAAFAYRFARTHAHDTRFTFGTGKVGDLAAFASAIILGLIAVLIAWESAIRLYSPIAIQFGEATLVATIGLVVNLVCAWLLFEGDDQHRHGHHHSHHGHDDGHNHDHARGHGHGHEHSHHGKDLNLRAAYLHVVADALTSVLAIVALLAGRYFGWVWLDPIIGIVGAIVIARWSYGLIRSSAATLLDTVPDRELQSRIKERLETGSDRISDLHLWQVGPGHHAAIVSIVVDTPESPQVYKSKLANLPGLSHVTVEVQRCSDAA